MSDNEELSTEVLIMMNEILLDMCSSMVPINLVSMHDIEVIKDIAIKHVMGRQPEENKVDGVLQQYLEETGELIVDSVHDRVKEFGSVKDEDTMQIVHIVEGVVQ